MANKTHKGKAQKPTATMDAYDRIRKNFIRQIKSMSERGYRNLPKTSEIKTARQIAKEKGSRNLSKEIADLMRQKASLYEQATAWSEELDMEISGTEKRVEEHRESGKKGAQTRKENERRKKDKDFQDEYDSSTEPSKSYNMLYGLMDIFQRISSTHPHQGGLLWEALQDRLANEDIDDLAEDLESIPSSELEHINDMFGRYSDDAPQLQDFVVNILDLITTNLTASYYRNLKERVAEASAQDEVAEVY